MGLDAVDSGIGETFADLLRRFRLQAGLTQGDLAVRSGVSARSISDLERGINHRPQRETAAMLSTGLGLSGAQREAFLEQARRRPRWTTAPARYPPLPEPSDPLLGREDELRAIQSDLIDQRRRLLTLTGPGGVGKTRLAIEAVRQFRRYFADGAVFVRLDGLSDPALVLPALAAALQIREPGGGGSALDRIAAHLAKHDLLIVLDNMEHLLPATPDLAELLSRAANARLIVTSRESLRIGGEHVVTVPPLPRPDLASWPDTSLDLPAAATSPAVRLFVQRALAQRPDLAVDPASPMGTRNLATISEICHRLDGLPLAIELAAAQAQTLSPVTILSLLQRAGLPLLSAGSRDQPARLQTMDAAIAWSYALLSPDEQALFRALSAFAGGFTVEAADAIADVESAPLLASLARRHLVIEDTTNPAPTGPRFRLLEPLRLFAGARLCASGEEERVRLRHARYFAELAEQLDAQTLGPDPELALAQQARDLDNFRAAQDWALASDEPALAARIAGYLAQFFLFRGLLPEGRRRVAAAIAVDANVPPSDRWFLQFWATVLAFEHDDVEAAARHAATLLEIAETADDPIGVGAGLSLQSQIVGATPDGHEEAAALARRAVDILEPLGRDEWTGSAWARLGIEHHRLGQLDDALTFLQRSYEVRCATRCEGCRAYSLALLGSISFDRHEPAAALDAYRHCLELTIKQGNLPLILAALLGLADVAWRYGSGPEPARDALALLGASEALRRRHGMGWDPVGGDAVRRWQALIRQQIGDERADHYFAAGLGLSLSQAGDLAQRLTIRHDSQPSGPEEESISLFAALGSIE